MNDLISRKAALDAITDELMPSTPLSVVIRAKNRLKDLPATQPDHTADSSKMVCVDAISRQETIHAISDWIYDTTDERLPEQVIRSLPAAQPAGKQGHWEVYFVLMSTHGDVEDEKCHCSECGREGVLWWNFCPNCGADMRGARND